MSEFTGGTTPTYFNPQNKGEAMSIQEYRESNLNVKPTADVAERWQKRVVGGGLDKQGRAGGVAYLDTYGKRIGAKKCVKFAVQAEAMGAQEFANVMWEKAYFLEEGELSSMNLEGTSEILIPVNFPVSETPEVIGLPPHLQPGKIATLQPQNIDRGGSVEALLEDSDWWMQQKIDGYRLLAICSPDEIHYQKRSLKLDTPPSAAIHSILLDVADTFGTIILDGELTYLDEDFGEHRTGAQALAANITLGSSEQPLVTYCVFDCLYFEGQDVTDEPYSERYSCVRHVDDGLSDDDVVTLPAAWDKLEKSELLASQKDYNKEGVIFRNSSSAYVAGKSGTAYRYKFLMEHELDVISLTDTTAEGRQFGAIETQLGLVGTGFTDADQLEIKQAFEKGGLRIEVLSQGLTENGRLWHPRFVKIIN